MSTDERRNGADLQDRIERAEEFKEFSPTSFAVEHRTSILVLLFIIALMGTFAYRATPKESFPEMAIPMLAINTIYPGVSPADVESQVTRVLEEDLERADHRARRRAGRREGAVGSECSVEHQGHPVGRIADLPELASFRDPLDLFVADQLSQKRQVRFAEEGRATRACQTVNQITPRSDERPNTSPSAEPPSVPNAVAAIVARG